MFLARSLVVLLLLLAAFSPTSSSGPTRPAFVSSVVPDGQLGLPPVRGAPRPAPVLPSKESDVTWRHKKWLSDFGERRGSIQATMEARVAEQAERARRFAERSQAMRDAIRGIKAEGDASDRASKARAIEQALGITKPKYVPTEYVEVSQQYPTGAPVLHDARQDDEPQQSPAPASYTPSAAAPSATPAQPAASRSSKSKAASAGALAGAKPSWARTAAEDDEFLEMEADSLLDFASGLDYQSYIDDLEVREALRFVQARVAGLEASKQTAEAVAQEQAKMIAAGELEEVWVVDESQPADPNTGQPAVKRIVRRTKRAQKQALTMADQPDAAAWNSSTAAGGEDQLTERDRLAQQEALSRNLLDSNRNLRNIHSSASVRAIMEKESGSGGGLTRASSNAAGGAATLRRSQQQQLASVSEPVQPPVITTIYERDHKGPPGLNPSNLPYLYRHPGI